MEFAIIFMYLLLASSAVNRIGDDSTQSNKLKQDVSVYLTMFLVYLVNNVFDYDKMNKGQKYYCDLKQKILERNIDYHEYIKIPNFFKRGNIVCHKYIKNILSYGIGLFTVRLSVVLIDDL